MSAVAPRIVGVGWGRIEIEGLGVFKDVKLWPGGGRAWDWRETGTRHRPGIQSSDVEELLVRGVEVVVLGRGMEGVLGVQRETVDRLAGRGVDVIVERTGRAVERYEELRVVRPTGALLHTTC